MRIEIDDDALQEAVEHANIPTLLMVLVHLSGDPTWLDPPYQPTRSRGMDDNDSGGLPTDVQQEIRQAVVAAVKGTNSGQLNPLERPDGELLHRMMSVCVGEDVPATSRQMLAEEMGLVPRAPVAATGAPSPSAGNLRVAVIGAGIGGICAAVQLREAGIPYTVYEKNDDIGGTWLENHYPGAGVDTPSHFYSYSFADFDWPTYFARRDDVYAYLRDVAERTGVTDDIQLDTEVTAATYHHERRSWSLILESADGRQEVAEADIVISAVGQLNRPKIPAQLDVAAIRGPAFHTARWPDQLDIAGARVGIIGTGASAMQVVPAIADTVGHLTIFQRSPQWTINNKNYRRVVSSGVRLLMQHLPYYREWYRFRLLWTYGDKVHASLQIDSTWPHENRSINATNDAHRQHFTQYIVDQVKDRPDLLAKVLPDYPPFGKRMLLDNGWFEAIKRDNVDLVAAAVDELTGNAVITADGQEYEVDILIFATGFETLRMLAPMDIRGRSNRTLRDIWGDDDASAYLGITIPEFPNLFCLYGPTTNLGHGGSVIFMIECQVRYIIQLLNAMVRSGIRAIEPRQDVHDAHRRRTDEAHERMIWSHPGMDNWYRNADGRVVTNTPWSLADYWAMTRKPELSDYHAYGRTQLPVQAAPYVPQGLSRPLEVPASDDLPLRRKART
jgi:4-hydroxyacetophenone monooxygenase